ncbi:MAG: acyl carrier protein [Candidatus Rokuibacteriota bacterium]
MSEISDGSRLSESQVLAHLRMLANTELELSSEQIARIELDTPLIEGLQLDSLKQVVLIANLEETYGFVLTPAELERLQGLRTVGDLVRMIRQRSLIGTWR